MVKAGILEPSIESNILKELANYVVGYRKRNSLTRDELSERAGVSRTSLAKVEQNNADGITFRSLCLISRLEFQSVSEFIRFLEGVGDPATGGTLSALELNLVQSFRRCSPEEAERFLTETNKETNSALIGARFDWAIRVANRLLDGDSGELVKREIDILKMSIDEKGTSDATKLDQARLIELLKSKYSY